jgi:NADH-quinone oxidoreductase subunit M
MNPSFFILIPLLAGLVSFILKQGNTAKQVALFASIATLAAVLVGVFANGNLSYSATWLPVLGAKFSLMADGMGKMLVLLTAIAFPIIIVATYNNNYKNQHAYYGLLLLAQTGLMGVFLAADCLLFYFFWELALIPVYFLCSIWGGEKRIAVTFKFFIYTFVGSLFMLIGILYVYFLNPAKSFSLESFSVIRLTASQENIAFWLFFIAFAIKMPIFPLHTWQPDAYEQSPTGVTMVLSGVMVKMGLFAVVRWLLPIFPNAAQQFSTIIMIVSVVGMIYASLIAMQQDDVKRLIAYSSIAHIGLMAAALFASNALGTKGAMVQMFNHGINVIGLWIVADAIEQKLGTRKLSELGGLAAKAPVLAILLVVLAFANVALPLTNAFIGEFLMFNALFQANIWLAVAAGITIILGAAYTLGMVQKIFYGNTVAATKNAIEVGFNIQLTLIILIIVIIAFGVYPQPIINLISSK